MTTLRESIRILLISTHPALAREIQTALSSEADFHLVGVIEFKPDLLQTVESLQADVILLDVPFSEVEGFDLIDEISARSARSAIVAILGEDQVELTERVILAGARAFLVYPFTTGSLFNTLKRLRELMLRTSPVQTPPATNVPEKPRGKNVVVYSPKGGAGCTTVAINLAIALRQQLGEEVLLVDGKPLLGHVALMLNLRTGNSIIDLIPHADKLDAGLIRQVGVAHVSGITVIPSMPTFSKTQAIHPEQLYKIILGLQTEFPNMIVDGGNYLDDNLITYMDAADHILLVINPNLAALRDARQFLDLAHSLSYPKDKVHILLNMAGHKADVKLGDIERVLRVKVIGTIPTDDELILSSINEGVPVVTKKSGHAISKAFKTLAKNLAELSGAQAPPLDRKTTPLDVLKKSSRLG